MPEPPFAINPRIASFLVTPVTSPVAGAR